MVTHQLVAMGDTEAVQVVISDVSIDTVKRMWLWRVQRTDSKGRVERPFSAVEKGVITLQVCQIQLWLFVRMEIPPGCRWLCCGKRRIRSGMLSLSNALIA